MTPIRRRTRRILWGVLGVLAVLLMAAGGFVWWASTPLGPSEEALAALESSDDIDVTLTDDLALFTPTGDEARVGIVLYPGGRVDFRSYAPLARNIAELGYLVAVPRVPLNLAVFEPDAAGRVIDAHTDILAWAVGGHSLGGTMAMSFADSHPGEVDAVVLLASYPSSGVDLSDDDFLGLSLFGTRDGILSEKSMEESVERMPADTTFEPIEGGNHAQFGSYGPQPGDNDATISAEEQQLDAAEAIALLMRPLRIKTLSY